MRSLWSDELAPHCQLEPKPANLPNIYKLGKIPRQLWLLGEKLESRFGKLGREYKNIVFDKECLHSDPTLEWVTPARSPGKKIVGRPC